MRLHSMPRRSALLREPLAREHRVARIEIVETGARFGQRAAHAAGWRRSPDHAPTPTSRSSDRTVRRRPSRTGSRRWRCPRGTRAERVAPRARTLRPREGPRPATRPIDTHDRMGRAYAPGVAAVKSIRSRPDVRREEVPDPPGRARRPADAPAVPRTRRRPRRSRSSACSPPRTPTRRRHSGESTRRCRRGSDPAATTVSAVPYSRRIGTGRAGAQVPRSSAPATGATAARRSASWHPSRLARKPPFDIPVT